MLNDPERFAADRFGDAGYENSEKGSSLAQRQRSLGCTGAQVVSRDFPRCSSGRLTNGDVGSPLT